MRDRILTCLKEAVGVAVIGATGVVNAAQPSLIEIPPSVGMEFWSNPSFVRQFLGSYGVRSEVEPEIDEDERAIFKRVQQQLPENLEAAAAQLDRSTSSDSSAALDFVLGNLRLQLGESQVARRHFDDALEKFPDFLRAHKNLGIVLVREGDFSDATEHLARAIELGAGGSQVYGLLGYCHLNRERLASAESAYRAAIVVDPENRDWMLGLAKSLLGQGKHREAEALFAELIDQVPENSDYWLHQANAYIALGEPMKAATNYEVVRLVDRLDSNTLANLGNIYLQQGLNRRALDVYLSVIEQGGAQDAGFVLQAAELLGERGDWPRVSTLIESLGKQFQGELNSEDERRLRKLQARRAMANDNASRAVDLWRQVLDEYPTDGEAILRLANYHANEGNLEQADLLYERAARVDEYQVRAWLRHAEMLVRQEEYQRAIRLLEKAQNADPQDRVEEYLQQVRKIAG